MSEREIRRRNVAAEFRMERSADAGTVTISGYAAVFDVEAYGEKIAKSAFNRTLAQRDDVRLLVNHDGVPLARTKSGTLQLTIDEIGLRATAQLDMSNPTVQELVSAMEREDIDQMSFAFAAYGEEMQDGVRIITEARLYDVSVVTYPWYESTSVALDRDRDLALCLRSIATGSPISAEQRELIMQILEPEEGSSDSDPVSEEKGMSLRMAQALIAAN